MKKVSVLLLITFLFIQLNAQYGIAKLIGPYFIQGNTGVIQQFTVDASNVPPNTTDVKFYITDVGYTTNYITPTMGGYDAPNDVYYFQIDMGTLPISAVGQRVAYGAFCNGNTELGIYTDDCPVTILTQPEWITNYNGQVTNTTVDYNNNTLYMHGQLPLNGLLNFNQNVSSITGLVGEVFQIDNQTLDFDIAYTMINGLATGSQISVSSDFQPLGDISSSISGGGFTGSMTFDNNFNLTFNGTAIITPPSIAKNFNFDNVPLSGGNIGIASGGLLCVNTSLNFLLQPKIKAQVYAGYDATSKHWRFKQNGSDVTQVLGKVSATAVARGELKAICGSIFGFSMGWGTIARGQVTAELNIGGGIQYYNMPSANTNQLWYGNFSLSAEGEVLGYSGRSGVYTSAWGNSSNFNFKNESASNEFFESATTESRSIQTPAAWTMEKISARDSVVACAWIDDINFGNNSSLLVTYYSPVTNAFSPPVTIALNDSGICNPSISLLPNKNIFITWSQLNKSKGQLSGLSLDDVTKSQDIYIAIVDVNTNNLGYKGKLYDAASDARADGAPRVYWGNGNQGMITWQASDNANTGSDIYAAEITENNGVYSIFNHSVLNANVGGFNYDVTVAYGNNNEAIATWLNDPDMDQTTHNSEVYFSSWNGSQWWLNPQLRFDVSTLGKIKEYSLATHNNYGVEALTYEYPDANEEMIYGIALREWDNGALTSLTTPDHFEQMDQETKLPEVSVSRNGIASLVLQETDAFNTASQGYLSLYLKDLNGSGQWQPVGFSAYATDTTQFVWDMSAKFGYLDNSTDVMYLFTQEMDDAGNTNATSYAKIFGNPNLNLLLRAFEVNSNGGTITLTDVAEPNDDNVTGFYQELSPFNYAFELKPCYPNPFNDATYIPLHVYESGNVSVELFNLSGQSLGEIYNADEVPAGNYLTKFTRTGIESGIYFYRVTMGTNTQTGKMVITD